MTRKHWWGEVKAFTKNIRQQLKRCKSKKQLMAALKDATNHVPRTPDQVADIEARLIEASKKMGEDIDELIPCR